MRPAFACRSGRRVGTGRALELCRLQPRPTCAGCGSPFAARLAKPSPSAWEILSPKAPVPCVSASRPDAAAGPRAATSGWPTRRRFHLAPTGCAAGTRDKPTTPNASAARCASVWGALFAKSFPSPNVTGCLSWPYACLFTSITSTQSVNQEPLPGKDVHALVRDGCFHANEPPDVVLMPNRHGAGVPDADVVGDEVERVCGTEALGETVELFGNVLAGEGSFRQARR